MDGYYALLISIEYGLDSSIALRLIQSPKCGTDKSFRDIKKLQEMLDFETLVLLQAYDAGTPIKKIAEDLSMNYNVVRNKIRKIKFLVSEVNALYEMGFVKKEDVEPLIKTFNSSISTAEEIERKRDRVLSYA